VLRVSLLPAFTASRSAHPAAYPVDLGRDHALVGLLFIDHQLAWLVVEMLDKSCLHVG